MVAKGAIRLLLPFGWCSCWPAEEPVLVLDDVEEEERDELSEQEDIIEQAWLMLEARICICCFGLGWPVGGAGAGFLTVLVVLVARI